MMPAAGERLLHYRLVEKIGEGGMGAVWRARDTTLDRDAAIKLLPDALAKDAQFLARFEREAKLLASLSHPNLAAVFGIHETEGTRFLAMEMVPGEDLADRIARGALPLHEVVPILTAVADALQAAHARGVVHRDLKPANIRLMPDGRVKVLDFGLAKSVPGEPQEGSSDEHPLTATGAVLGTAPYMSPEQARGRPVDARADIWSYGCVLWECLVGERPFQGDSLPDLVVAILNHEPAWRKLPEGTPPSLRRLLRRCLAKSPRDRLHHIADARIELEESVEEPAPPEIAARIPGRRRVLSLLILPVVLAGLLLALPRNSAVESRERILADARFTKLTNDEGEELCAVISPDGSTMAFVSNRLGPFETYVGRIGAGRYLNLSRQNGDATITGIKEPVCHLGFHGDGGGLWVSQTPAQGSLLHLPLPVGSTSRWLVPDVLHVDWSPDRSRIIYSLARDGDPVFVANPNGTNARLILPSHPGYHQHFPTWSADGRWIYVVRGYVTKREMDLWRMRPDGSDLQQMTQGKQNVRWPVPIDARTVLYIAEERNKRKSWLWELDVGSGTSRRATLGVEQYQSVSASQDRRRLVATVVNPKVGLWTVPILPEGRGRATEQHVERHPIPAVRALAPRVRGDQLFYLSSIGGGDGLWRYRDGKSEEIWKGPLLEPAAVSPDGDRVAVVVRDGSRARLHVMRADGTEPRALMPEVEIVGAASWSPDGVWIAAGGVRDGEHALYKVRVEDGRGERIVTAEAIDAVWSPDGGLIVFAGPQISAFTGLHAVTPEGEPRRLPIPVDPSAGGHRFRFLPDGSGLVYLHGRDPHYDFHLLDLRTGRTRRLTELTHSATMHAFDIMPDGKTIVFDRQYDNGDIVLIERDAAD